MTILGRGQLGVHLSADRVHAVLVRRERIVRWWSVEIGDHPSLEDALTAALRPAGTRGPMGPAVFVAIGVSASRVRRLTGLPAIADLRTLTVLVKGNIDRFFTHAAAPLICARVARAASGEVWAAAYDESVVRAVVRACRSARLKLSLVTAAPCALHASSKTDTATWREGDILMRSRFDSRGMPVELSYRHVRSEAEEPARSSSFVAPLARLGDEGSRYALAFGAVLARNDVALDLRPRDLGVAVPERPSRRRVLTAAAALATSMVCIAAGPLLVNGVAESRARARIHALGPALDTARVLESALTSGVAEANAFARFVSGRRSFTRFLGELTEAIPDGAWIASLTIDPQGGKLVVIGPSTSEILTALADAPSIGTVTIEGSVSPERVGDERLERSTVRFRWAMAREAAQRDTVLASTSSAGAPDE